MQISYRRASVLLVTVAAVSTLSAPAHAGKTKPSNGKSAKPAPTSSPTPTATPTDTTSSTPTDTTSPTPTDTTSPTPTTSTVVSTSLRSLTQDRLTIGVRDKLLTTGQFAWLPTTGVPFDSVYQYVSGTGPGTPGDYHVSTMVAFAKRAQLAGRLPVLSYFRMDGNTWGPDSTKAACTGSCTLGDTAKRNLDHLGDANFMKYYFAGLVDAFQQLNAQYTGQMVLHVEPDLSGYAQMLSNDRTRCGTDCLDTVPVDDPRGVRAAVASSGQPELASYPDTLQGFFLAVLHLRDLYAPRVSLAYHVSNWATANVFRKSGTNDPTNDISQSHVAVDADALAARVARFAALNGATTSTTATFPGEPTSRYDLLFNDVMDHDAAHAEVVNGNPNYWWDTENIDLPNYHRWETYIGGITSRTGLKATVWQIPIGNQVFMVENDTPGHYQDNRVQYLFSHLAELPAVGITGLIFGAGTSDSTWSSDNRLDVTDNSTIVCSTRGNHSGTLICPTRVAVLPDDDGGYLREKAAAYFANPLRLPL